MSHESPAVPAPDEPPETVGIGNRTVLGAVEGVAYDESQLSREEAAQGDPRVAEALDASPASPLIERRPVAMAGVVGALGSAAAVFSAASSGRLSPPKALVMAAAAAFAVIAPVLFAQGYVTPVTSPRDDDDNVLVPVG